MIAVAIIAVVASLAVPAYFDSLRKGRRAEAITALTAVLQAQERRRANAPSYTATLADLPGGLAATTPSGYYGIVIADATATGYAVTATAVTGSSQAKDLQCKAMQIKVAGGNILYGSACSTCTMADPPTDPKRCWSK